MGKAVGLVTAFGFSLSSGLEAWKVLFFGWKVVLHPSRVSNASHDKHVTDNKAYTSSRSVLYVSEK